MDLILHQNVRYLPFFFGVQVMSDILTQHIQHTTFAPTKALFRETNTPLQDIFSKFWADK